MRKRSLTMLIAIAALVCASLVFPVTAHAESPKIITPTNAENIAYNRCVKAAYAYKSKPDVITVSIKDLKLNMSQVIDVETRLHSNGELWWINTFGLGLSTTKITMPCKYSDAEITKKRAKFEKAVANALKYIGPGMTANVRVHMMHDYIIRFVAYKATYKNAYEALVNKRGDCFGYTLAEDVLLRRAGYETDVAYNNKENVDHSWNLVKLGNSWYHVDTTWDRYYTYNSSTYEGRICHIWLLQPDSVMSRDEHKGWEAHHRCDNKQYVKAVYEGEYFDQHCKDFKKIVRSFNSNGLTYKVIGVGKVSVSGVAKAKRKAAKLYIPKAVKYKNVKYAVCGLRPDAFKGTSAKTLFVSSGSFTKARVKNSLRSSKIKYVCVPKAKLKLYKAYFKKANCGRAVIVLKRSSATFLRAARLYL